MTVERDPTKRKVKPAQALFDFEDLGESSDDSDFRIEDHCEESDDDSIDSNGNDRSSGKILNVMKYSFSKAPLIQN